MKKVFLSGIIAITAVICCAEVPVYEPPFKIENSARKKAELKIGSFFYKKKNYEQPSLVAGNKRVGLRELYGSFRGDRDYLIGIYADKKEVARIVFWGVVKGVGSGFPFKDIAGKNSSVEYSKENNTITYKKDYALADGTTATFSFQLKALEDSQIELTWNSGLSEEKLKSLMPGFTLEPWVELGNDYREKNIKLAQKLIVPAPMEKLATTKGKEQKTIHTKANQIMINEFDLNKKVILSLSEIVTAQLRERYWSPKNINAKIHFNVNPLKTSRRMIIDLGSVATEKATPPPVAGIDFWGNDATHVSTPPTKNIFMNPSFNQGLRYFHWINGGGRYVPATQRRFDISLDGGIDNSPALLIRSTQHGSVPLRTFPLLLKKGQKYTLSCYAKSDKNGTLVMAPFSASGGQFNHGWRNANKKIAYHKLTPEWTRYTCAFTYKSGAVCMLLDATGGDVYIDNIMVQEGNASEFVAQAIEGNLETSNRDNLINLGDKIDAKFNIFGNKGELELTLFDFYRQKRWTKSYKVKGGDKLTLPFDDLKLERGNFVLQANYIADNGETYSDYYRFNVMDFLKNEHATKDMFGTESRYLGRTSRGEDIAHLMMVSGMGSVGYGQMYNQQEEYIDLLKKYKISNMVYTLGGHSGFNAMTTATKEDKLFLQNIVKKSRKVTPEELLRIEKLTYDYVKSRPEAKEWSFNHEEESRSPMLREKDFGEWAKVLTAFNKGVKRANPNAIIIPDGGTTNFHRGDKRIINDKYFSESIKLGAKWNGAATHPYGSLDGTKAGYLSDLDEVLGSFLNLMAKYGLKDGPLYCTEGFNLPGQYIPEWGCGMWNDPYSGGKASYDYSLREFNQAAWLARTYLIGLKYWPKVKRIDCWSSMFFFDYYLTPYAMMNAINTMGHLLGNPKFVGDATPAPGVRSYVWSNEKGEAVAAVWVANVKVEEGLISGPRIDLNFSGKKAPEVIDLMGNTRNVELSNGLLSLPLSAAPIFLRGGSAQEMLKKLQNAEVIGGDSNVSLAVKPNSNGKLSLEIKNLTARDIKGVYNTAQGENSFEVKGNGSVFKDLANKATNQEVGKIYNFTDDIKISMAKGGGLERKWDINYFYIPYSKEQPNWKNIPAIAIDNVFVKGTGKYTGNSDLNASFKAAWNENNLYLRVEAEDDNFVLTPELFKEPVRLSERLYDLEGCLEVYIDCSANGVGSNKLGFDDDDYRYDIAYGNASGKSGTALVNRLRTVHSQLVGGVAEISRDAANKGVKAYFTKTAKGYIYDVIFERKYLEPMNFKPNEVVGFALYLHDRDSKTERQGIKGLNIGTAKGKHIDHAPNLWPMMILKK